MVAALGNSKDYTLKQYLVFVDKLQAKAKVRFSLSVMILFHLVIMGTYLITGISNAVSNLFPFLFECKRENGAVL